LEFTTFSHCFFQYFSGCWYRGRVLCSHYQSFCCELTTNQTVACRRSFSLHG